MTSSNAQKLADKLATTNHSPAFQWYFKWIDGEPMPPKGTSDKDDHNARVATYEDRYRKAAKAFFIENCQGNVGLEVAKKLWASHCNEQYVLKIKSKGGPSKSAATSAMTGAVAAGADDDDDVVSRLTVELAAATLKRDSAKKGPDASMGTSRHVSPPRAPAPAPASAKFGRGF